MAERFHLGALLGHVYTLESGIQVRLRLARSSDISALRELFARQGLDRPDFEAARLVRFDPRRRYVLCATGLVGSAERLVGVGAITLDGATLPEMLLVDEEHAEVAPLLRRSLVQSAELLGRPRAA